MYSESIITDRGWCESGLWSFISRDITL